MYIHKESKLKLRLYFWFIPTRHKLLLRSTAILQTSIVLIHTSSECAPLNRASFLNNGKTTLEKAESHIRIQHTILNSMRLLETLFRVLTFRFALHKRNVLLRASLLYDRSSGEQVGCSGDVLGNRSFRIHFY